MGVTPIVVELSSSGSFSCGLSIVHLEFFYFTQGITLGHHLCYQGDLVIQALGLPRQLMEVSNYYNNWG